MDGHVVISLGVGDIEHAKQFYCDGLGFELERAEGPFAAFKQSNGGPGLALYSGDPLKYDAGVVEDRGGYRGVSLAYVVDTAERVDELMARAERAAATILVPAHRADWGGYLGYFTDPDGNFWRAVVGQTG
jgi:catechol 2,3-dioxygenase-like lactoylglutathione lyase family enzyme